MKIRLPTCFLFPVILLLAACSDKEMLQGEKIYTEACKVCHAQGINGAPVLGNQKMWSVRRKQGEDILVQHAMEGYGLMPAKGGRDHLMQQDIRLAIRYMLSQLPD